MNHQLSAGTLITRPDAFGPPSHNFSDYDIRSAPTLDQMRKTEAMRMSMANSCVRDDHMKHALGVDEVVRMCHPQPSCRCLPFWTVT